MSRSKQFFHTITLKVDNLDRSLLAYYAHRYNRDQSKVMRAMIREYTRYDKNFDDKDYHQFLRKTYLPTLSEDDAQEVAARGKEFVADLLAARKARRRKRKT